jgi:hypothetical protein
MDRGHGFMMWITCKYDAPSGNLQVFEIPKFVKSYSGGVRSETYLLSNFVKAPSKQRLVMEPVFEEKENFEKYWRSAGGIKTNHHEFRLYHWVLENLYRKTSTNELTYFTPTLPSPFQTFVETTLKAKAQGSKLKAQR